VWLVVAAAMVGFGDVSLCDTAVASEAAEASEPADDLNSIAERLQRALANTPELGGAWVDIEVDPDAPEEGPPRFIFKPRVVDSRRADKQFAALDRLARELVPSGHYRFDPASDRRLPLGELLDGLQATIRRDLRFPGCEVLGAGYRLNPDDGTLELVPRFRVARDGQFDALAEECRRQIHSSPAWAKVSVYDGDADQKVVVPEPPEPELNELFARVRQAVRQVPALRGSWLDVETDDQGYPGVAPQVYRFRRAFDSRRLATQADAMERLAKQLIPSGRYRFEAEHDRKLPLSELVDALKREIDIEPRFAGCSLAGATYRYNEDDDSFDLVLHGRVWKEAQVDFIAELCREYMGRDPVWEAAGVQLQTPRDDGLVVVPESPRQAAVYYSQAMHHFWKMEYDEADRLLSLATVEDPKNVVYRYWRVLGELSRGDSAAGERRLQKTIDGYRVRKYSQAHVDVMRSIYRIQGPLRLRLIDAENKAMMRTTVSGGHWD
jgi:hypothetical protein